MNNIPLIFYAILGAAIGSFLNVVIDRLPDKRSIISPPSHCDHCDRKLNILELIPVFSYLILGGKCRSCKERIPLRNLFVEVLTSGAFLLIWFKYGQSWQTLLYSLYASLLILMGSIDLEHQKIPNILVYPAIGIGLIMIPLLHLSTPWMMLAGGLLGFGVLFLIAVIAPGAMGMGDVKLVLFLGIILGFPDIVLTLFLAFVTGGLIAGFLLALKKLGKKDTIAFGPFLALAGIITLLYGSQILDWWLRRVGG
jgi:prepilin signal peptidase PulO-like enzyme (type II secretory pathway)